MKRRAIHGATVEQVRSEEDCAFIAPEDAFRAVCLVTGTACDAWAFVDDPMLGPDEGFAIQRALGYIGDRSLHDSRSQCFCDATHVMEHDLVVKPKRGPKR